MPPRGPVRGCRLCPVGMSGPAGDTFQESKHLTGFTYSPVGVIIPFGLAHIFRFGEGQH